MKLQNFSKKNKKVFQKAIISLFLKLDLDDAIFARTPANCSFRNYVERMHAYANIGLQPVGIMRGSMSVESENKLKEFGENVEIRTTFETESDFLSEVAESLEKQKQIIETVLSNLSLKGKSFKIYQPVEDIPTLLKKMKSYLMSMY